MTRARPLLPLAFPLAVCLGLLAACGPASPASSPTPSASAVGAIGEPSPSASPSATDAGTESPVSDYRVVFGFAVPAADVSTEHGGATQVRLTSINAADHGTESPAYQRISFYFDGGFPDYAVAYAPAVLTEGKGDALPLPGSAFLRVAFTNAAAHDDAGTSTLASSAPTSLGLPTLLGYGLAGDFEGHVTVGLGLSGQVPIRVGELRRGAVYAVFVDVQPAA